METTDVDPEQFMAAVNEMSAEQHREALLKMTSGGQSMKEARDNYSRVTQTNESKYYNQP